MDDPVQGDQLRGIVERIERLEEEKKTISDDIKEVYAEAKGNGYDVKVLRKVIARRKRDRDEIAEEEAIIDLYEQAVGDEATPVARAAAPGFASRAASPMARSAHISSERVSRPAETRPGAEAGSAVKVGAPEFHEPDATPAGAVVAIRSGVTAGESTGSGYSAATEAPTDSCSGTDRPNGGVGSASGAAETPVVTNALAAANAIAVRAVTEIPPAPTRIIGGAMPDIPAFLRRPTIVDHPSFGDHP